MNRRDFIKHAVVTGATTAVAARGSNAAALPAMTTSSSTPSGASSGGLAITSPLRRRIRSTVMPKRFQRPSSAIVWSAAGAAFRTTTVRRSRQSGPSAHSTTGRSGSTGARSAA